MCLAAPIIDERADRLLALLHATRMIMAANAEISSAPYAGAIVLVEETERGINALAQELKANCPEARDAGEGQA